MSTVQPFKVACFTRVTQEQRDTIEHLAAMQGVRFATKVRELIELGLACSDTANAVQR